MMRTIISILCVIAAAGIFFWYTQPTYDSVQALTQQNGQYDQALEKATELQTLKQQLLTRYNAFNPSDIDRLQKLLPDHVDNVRLILDLDSLAGKHGMALQNVAVSSDVETAGTNQSTSAAIGSSKQKYDSLTIKFTTQGTYDAFKSFLTDLETSLRVVDLSSLSISNATTQNQSTDPVYTFDITLRTYWLK